MLISDFLNQGRPRLKKAIADAHSASFGRKLYPDSEVTITTGANEGSAGLKRAMMYITLWLTEC